MSDRRATVERTTKETSITATLCLDGTGVADVETGLGFLDHMLTSLTKHARLDLTLRATGPITSATTGGSASRMALMLASRSPPSPSAAKIAAPVMKNGKIASIDM